MYLFSLPTFVLARKALQRTYMTSFRLTAIIIMAVFVSSCSKNVTFGISDPLEGSNTNEIKEVILTGVSVRDPALILSDSTYYLFSTGNGIKIWSSTDLVSWKVRPPVFPRAPTWTSQNIPDFNNHIWAPEITYYKGQYYLFYSVSSFGSNNSAIGFATNETLNSNETDYKWIDHGMITQSHGTSWNAIDPNFFLDDNSEPYLLLGSYFSGIKITRIIDNNLTLKAEAITSPTLAKRDPAVNPYNAIEAPFLFKHNKYYYLFTSINNCCSGINSDYKTIVGRSRTINGPYLDRQGKAMSAGGGELVLQGNQNWHGAGGASVYNFKGQDKIVFFSYDNTGVERLRIADVSWDNEDWPLAELKDK